MDILNYKLHNIHHQMRSLIGIENINLKQKSLNLLKTDREYTVK